MDKKTQYEKTMKYYKILLNTVEKNKQEKKGLAGHRIFGLATNPIYDSISVSALTVALSFILSLAAKFPAYYSIPVAAVGSFTVAMAIPLALRQAFFHSRTKIGRGYAKMELNTYFVSMKNNVKENMQSLMNSSSYEDVTEEQLEGFALIFGNVAQNYKTALDKYVGKKIFKDTKRDYQKIQRILNNEKNQEKNKQKVEKIINKSEKVLKPWCELYNSCGKIAQNLYKGAHELDAEFELLPENKFVADDKLLRKKVNHYVMTKSAREIKADIKLPDKKTEKKNKISTLKEVEETFEDEKEKGITF